MSQTSPERALSRTAHNLLRSQYIGLWISAQTVPPSTMGLGRQLLCSQLDPAKLECREIAEGFLGHQQRIVEAASALQCSAVIWQHELQTAHRPLHTLCEHLFSSTSTGIYLSNLRESQISIKSPEHLHAPLYLRRLTMTCLSLLFSSNMDLLISYAESKIEDFASILATHPVR